MTDSSYPIILQLLHEQADRTIDTNRVIRHTGDCAELKAKKFTAHVPVT